MPSLVEEELARRDAALASPSGTPYRSQKERAAEIITGDKQRHDDEQAAARDAILKQRAADSERRAGIAEDRMKFQGDVAGARIDLLGQQRELEAAKQELVKQEQATKDARSLEIINQAAGFLKDARGMDPSKKEFDSQLQDLYAGYPLAAAHPSVERWQQYHVPLRERYVNEEIANRKPTPPPKPEKTGNVTTVVDASGKPIGTKIVKPLPAPGSPEAERVALEQQHSALEAKMAAGRTKFTGKYDPKLISDLNAVKQKLGYDLIDPTDPNKTIPAAAPFVPATTIGAPSNETAVPTEVHAVPTTGAPATTSTPPPETPEVIAARIKAGGGTKDDLVKALRDAGHPY